MNRLLTYIELAEALGLAPGTVKNNWRIYDPIIVTENGLRNPTLKSARFTLERTLAALESQNTHNGGRYGYQENKEKKGNHVSGHMLVSGQAAHQGLRNAGGGKGMGGEKAGATGDHGGHIAHFDVLRHVR